ncbi:YgaP family membrane protein [Thiohalobacter sp.]|uniref:YgaP family membrane protein n=1 Tax=Thiohalobacter sp. TaxID=2025948 RepID=UPI0026025F16|nr:DUF2892 domain-containing protein [Thiohalobacter sp.]
MKLQPNIGRVDQLVRIGISAGLLYISLIDEYFISDAFSSAVIATLGIINLAVAIIRYCPFYALAGINTAQLS